MGPSVLTIDKERLNNVCNLQKVECRSHHGSDMLLVGATGSKESVGEVTVTDLT